MIKSVYDITESEILAVSGRSFDIYEMLDMVLFKITTHSGDGDVVRKIDGGKVGISDKIFDSVWRDIDSFSKCIDIDAIRSAVGDCTITLAYLPVCKSKVIDYDTITPGGFYIIDAFCDDKSLKDYDVIGNAIAEGHGEWIVYGQPLVMNGCVLPDGFFEMDDFGKRSWILSQFDETYSGLGKESVEGYILDFGNRKFKLPITDTTSNIDLEGSMLYRNAVLGDFSKVVLSDLDFVDRTLNSSKDYVSAICSLFVEYMYRTDMFGRMEIDAEDVVYPHNGYIGEPDFDMIPGTAGIVCRYDRRMCNILNIIMHTFERRVSIGKVSGIRSDESKSRIVEFSKKMMKYGR